tara:strand:+ start:26 stop:1096 length:1071 start_codon:yes stop_codon:yes gene_type:complete
MGNFIKKNIYSLFTIFKILIFNIVIFISTIILLELFLGDWFNNPLKNKLSSERNINRIYSFKFSNYEGHSHYKRDNFAFRSDQETVLDKVDVVFTGGSTTNQKFLKTEDTFVSLLDKKNKKTLIVNAGIDGMSIRGHIKSFQYWFNKMPKLKPKYFIFYIGINDQQLFTSLNTINDYKAANPIDSLKESNALADLREYLESNSFFYNSLREIKAKIFLNFSKEIGANKVNSKTIVYGKRSSSNFTPYNANKFKKLKIPNSEYLELLNTLTKEVSNFGSKPIYITQISGNGMNERLYLISETIMHHCKKKDLVCINLAKKINLDYSDFYDGYHLNPNGSKKVFTYLDKELRNKKILY